MFQPPAPIAPASPLQRSRGEAQVALAHRGGRARLADLFQSGAAKAILPRVDGPEPEVVFLNTAGGVTGGDSIGYRLALGPGLRAVATTQAAERVYASAGGTAELRVALTVAAGCRLDWLPQETIVFQDAALRRRTEVDLAGTAACLIAETVVLGRAAMGETLRRAEVHDLRLLRRDGRPVLVEALAIGTTVLERRDAPALLRGARALATVALVAPGAEAAVAAVRRVLDEPGTEAAASGWDGRCVVRVLGADGWPVRRQVARVLAVLRDRPPPRVWQL